MNAIPINQELLVRLLFFFGILAIMAAWEVLAPRRPFTVSRPARWLSNLSIVTLNSLVLRWLFPLGAVGFATIAEHQQWGLLNQSELADWIQMIIGIIALDFIIYLQHAMFHAIPLLWRLHMVHHTDIDLDVTTGGRFHPVEIILSMAIKLAAIAVFGPSATAVLIFEILLNGTSMFNHSNIHLPLPIDRILRLIIVTPDMHRVHHSVHKNETNSNFGFNLPWWDRLFGTYCAQPIDGHSQMVIGLEHYRDNGKLALLSLLAIPFTARIGNYPINRRDNSAD